MIDPAHRLPIVRQARLLELSRSSVYYRPQPTSDADLALMRRIDELHLEHPFAGPGWPPQTPPPVAGSNSSTRRGGTGGL